MEEVNFNMRINPNIAIKWTRDQGLFKQYIQGGIVNTNLQKLGNTDCDNDKCPIFIKQILIYLLEQKNMKNFP